MFPSIEDLAPVLDSSFDNFFHLVPHELRPGNPNRPIWQGWLNDLAFHGFHCASDVYHHDKCWGWTILRTSYDDDEKFERVVSAIHRLALVRLEDEYRESRTTGLVDTDSMDAVEYKLRKTPGPQAIRRSLEDNWYAMVEPARAALPPHEPLTSDWVISYEMARRLHNVVIQEKESLDGADTVKAWEYVHTHGLIDREHGARGALFIVLDQESIDLLSATPSKEELSKMSLDDRIKTAWTSWVKAVSPACETDEDGNDTDPTMEYPLGRRRIRLYHLFETFLYLCEKKLDEIGVEGHDRERAKSDKELEWEFCELQWMNGPKEDWLFQIYGEVVPRRYQKGHWGSRPRAGILR